ncbi:iron chelate uptake ABC transporter family permease subunit [Acholeplasma hippikon]|nr:iron chelate uptake ABC transporter family permease subunit [Acholeplasma hippikon]
MRKKYWILGIIATVGIILYMLAWIASQFNLIIFNLSDPARAPYFWKNVLDILSRRGIQVTALIIASVLISMSTLTFQTLTSNRIVTPSLLGLDAIYVVIQTTIVFFVSYLGGLISNAPLNFLFSVVVMSGSTILLYTFFMKKHKKNLLLLLLVGMVISTLASNYSTFLQILMDPDAFQTVAQLTSVSIVSIETSLVFVALPIAIVIGYFFFKKSSVYDVMSLGEFQAKNLGINYQNETYKTLILISLAISITTALVGPLAFLGLISVNAAKEMFKKYQHKTLFITSCLISLICLVLGQAIIELTGYKTTVTTVINLIGGIYMINLIVKEHKL